jgi:hypothetical protein
VLRAPGLANFAPAPAGPYAIGMRVLVVVAAASLGIALTAAEARADVCYRELDARGVAYKRAKKPGIELGVEITGRLGDVEMTGAGSLVIDCSLAVSLDEVGRYMRALGIDRLTYSSAYSQRNVRGTSKPSKHSYGLAIDVHGFAGKELGSLVVRKDYEQGLGDAVDCIGMPATQGGAILKILQCQLVRSGLFYLVLSPDYDDAHHDHFHLEVRPWREREALRSATPAIH